MVQVNIPYHNLRIKFRKVGDLQYVSHLDLVRTMQKALKRAGLNMWYTEGFNPKPKMVFGPPLSIGVESECEFLDIRLLDTPDCEAIKAAVNQSLSDSLAAIAVYEPEHSLAEIEWLSYFITISTKEDAEAVCKKLRDFFEKSEINILKKTKKGEQTVDIRPLIKTADVAVQDGCASISCLLSSSSERFLNPEHLIRAIKEQTDIFMGDLLNEQYTVLRRCAYLADMTEFN